MSGNSKALLGGAAIVAVIMFAMAKTGKAMTYGDSAGSGLGLTGSSGGLGGVGDALASLGNDLADSLGTALGGSTTKSPATGTGTTKPAGSIIGGAPSTASPLIPTASAATNRINEIVSNNADSTGVFGGILTQTPSEGYGGSGGVLIPSPGQGWEGTSVGAGGGVIRNRPNYYDP